MYTIGQIAKKFSMSRSALLYYDSIGLLSPSGRSEANYRLYSDNDILKMQKIVHFRETGLSLESIANILEMDNNKVSSVLEDRLFIINEEIQNMRYQQSVIIKILENKNKIKNSRIMTKDQWVSLLQATGLNDSEMEKWHIEFERISPEAHQDFLESLGIQEQEIKSIRKLSSCG